MSKITDLDKDCFDSVDMNANMMIPWYLMACYAYYEEDDPILTDAGFDRLCKKMIEKFDEIEHMHKGYVTEDNLSAGTYIGEYPSRIKGAVRSLKDIYYGKQKFGRGNR